MAWGGHEHGEVASALARDTLVHEITGGAPLAQAVQRADEEIIQHSSRKAEALPDGHDHRRAAPAQQRLRSLLGRRQPRIHVEWRAQALSQDHSYVQELIQQGAITHEQARTHLRTAMS
jgi:protein phosphatase